MGVSVNLAQDCIEKPAARIPNRPAIIDYETGATITYAELNKKVNSMANAEETIKELAGA